MKLYELNVKNAKDEVVSLSQYKGKVILIFNSATKCGYTNQYEGLEALYEKYQKQGLEILDFPSNQFMNQAPGSNEELSNFCKLKFGTKFETFAKVDVNGKDAAPLFQFLRKTIKGDYPTEGSLINRLFRRNDKIKWNFTKFLIDREGNVIKRFAPSFKPEEIEPFIQAVL